jgi:hormone-sensitive lipase
MHGGGFICQNTFLHQTYIRRWANMLNIPFFSVEYRKSPQWAYPAALDDSFQTYMWLVTLFDQVYDARPPKIILIGDSAGGNLATGVTALAVKFRVRIPDALALVYPAFDLCPENFFPSRIASLDDYLLPTSVLRLCK